MQLDFPITPSELTALRTGSVLTTDSAAIFRIEGPGALECLQGLLTSDLAAPGDGSLLYGAMLTAKGMILIDPWVLRDAERFTLVLTSQARETAAQLFGRVLPPRLARVSDLSEGWSAAWLFGSGSSERVGRALALPPPPPGRVARLPGDAVGLVASGAEAAPFVSLVLAPRAELDEVIARLLATGVDRGTATAHAAAMVLAGWPASGREIDERTLPQEVRFDELGAVSYVKGCYTGQETVARVHFRGHVNRVLRGVTLEGGEAPETRSLRLDGKEVGGIRTALLVEDRVLALAVVRREIADGAVLQAGEREATIVPLPFRSG